MNEKTHRRNNLGQRPRICILRSTRDAAISDQLENRVNFAPTVAPGFSIARFSSVRNWLSCLDLGRLRCWTRPLPRGPLGVLVSLGLVRAERPGIGFDVNLFWVEQGDLKNWLESDTGHGNPGWYSPARSTATDLTRTVGDPPIQPIGTWRLIGRWNHFTLQEISWLEGRRRSHVHAVACAAIDSWRASLPEPPEEQDSLTPQSRATANRLAGSRGASAESMQAQTRAHHQHRQPSCDCFTRWSISSSSISRGGWTGRA